MNQKALTSEGFAEGTVAHSHATQGGDLFKLMGFSCPTLSMLRLAVGACTTCRYRQDVRATQTRLQD